MLQWIAAAAGALAGFFLSAPAPFRLLVLLMALDYASGFAAAMLGKSRNSPSGTLSSKVGFIGLAKKAMILAIVFLAAVLDGIFSGTASVSAVTLFYIVNESLSILENAVLLGVPIPKRLARMLEVVQEKE